MDPRMNTLEEAREMENQRQVREVKEQLAKERAMNREMAIALQEERAQKPVVTPRLGAGIDRDNAKYGYPVALYLDEVTHYLSLTEASALSDTLHKLVAHIKDDPRLDVAKK